jgi:protein-S-isoprenylcysteine O-methyltransferase Ste14
LGLQGRFESQLVEQPCHVVFGISEGCVSKQDTPGVIAPPPLIYLAALVVGLGLGYLAPTPFLPRSLAYGLGTVFILIGAWISIPARQMMLRAGTAVKPYLPTTALVITGPFRFTRNPLYVGLTLFYLGIAVAARSLWALALLLVVLTVMQRGVIDREERYLEHKFGAEYVRYRERVRRWI